MAHCFFELISYPFDVLIIEWPSDTQSASKVTDQACIVNYFSIFVVPNEP